MASGPLRPLNGEVTQGKGAAVLEFGQWSPRRGRGCPPAPEVGRLCGGRLGTSSAGSGVHLGASLGPVRWRLVGDVDRGAAWLGRQQPPPAAVQA